MDYGDLKQLNAVAVWDENETLGDGVKCYDLKWCVGVKLTKGGAAMINFVN